PTGHHFIVLAAMFYLLALFPTAVTSTRSPSPLLKPRLDIARLYRRSPVAVVAVFLVGISNSAFGTLAAVYATGIGLQLATVALFASLPILAGAVLQVPIGLASDRMDRRIVLAAVALAALGVDLAFLMAPPGTPHIALALAAGLGSTIF